MSSVRNPVGPQPASVYWRRRLFALLGLVAIIVIIVLIVVGLQSGGGAPAPSPTPSNSASAIADSGDDEDACNPAVIKLEPLTDANPYPAGQQPMISMRITNTGSSACTLAVGTDVQDYFIVSGSDPIWNSRDCQIESIPLEMVIEPNVPITTNPFAWDRTRSSPSTCSSARPEVIAAGSTYRLSVKLGDITSPEGGLAFILN